MALYTVQREGYIDVNVMMLDVIKDMVDNGFSLVYPVSFNTADTSQTTYRVLLQAGVAVDSLAATQPWRICIDVANETQCGVYVATPFQLTNDASIPNLTDGTGANQGKIGVIGKAFPQSGTPTVEGILDTDYDTGFINRKRRFTSDFPTSGTPTRNRSVYPMNYRLTISGHGVFLCVYEGNWASQIFGASVNSYMSWFLVQRPVNKTTGVPLTTGKSPVFCVNCVNDKYWRFIVREKDIPHPTNQLDATAHSEDAFRLINTENQISLSEDSTYLVTFPNHLNTPRYRYTEELDMIGYTSADIIMDSSTTTLSAYGGTRTYTALPCSNPFNTGVRILVLTAVAGG